MANEKILVVDDDKNICELLRLYLVKEGYSVTMAHDGEAALTDFDKLHPDLVLLDVMMPVMDGWEVCRKIRAKDNTPIIMLTAKGETYDKVLGLELGADDYIVKPFSLSVLMLKLEAFVKRNKGAAEHRTGSAGSTGANTRSGDIVSGALRFSPERMEASLDGEPVQLTRNEYRLLSVFLRNPGQVLSKEQLLMQAFDIYGDFVDENTLAVNISRLREKLRDDAQDPVYIRNVRGLGYIWMKKLQ